MAVFADHLSWRSLAVFTGMIRRPPPAMTMTAGPGISRRSRGPVPQAPRRHRAQPVTVTPALRSHPSRLPAVTSSQARMGSGTRQAGHSVTESIREATVDDPWPPPLTCPDDFAGHPDLGLFRRNPEMITRWPSQVTATCRTRSTIPHVRTAEVKRQAQGQQLDLSRLGHRQSSIRRGPLSRADLIG